MTKRYKIYPLPQKIEYEDRNIDLPKALELESDLTLDTACEQRLEETLKVADLQLLEQSGSDSVLKLSIKLNQKLAGNEGKSQEAESDKFDAYNLTISEQGIEIEAADDTALYYALTTLYHIFDQSKDDKSLELLTIEDYADTKLRGMIEGFYGIPYTNKKRKSLVEFGSYFKMNIYAFAPKDDPYHRDLWWELYPEDELKEIEDLAKFSLEHGVNYTWTIAPFKPDSHPIKPENKEEGLQKVITKFEQLYEAGVREFGVLGDDVGDLPYETVVFVLNSLNKWRKDKKDVADLIFCPQGYNMDDWAFKDGTEANVLDEYLDEDVHIFYTGETTCNVLSDRAIERWKTEKAAPETRVRRDPLFWMNWPVNDIDRDDKRRVFLGKGEVYEQGVKDVVGVMTNPMDEAEASKVALFATLDFSWNVDDFDADISWEDSFAYIEPDAQEALHEIAKHMSNIKNGAKEDAEESTELKKHVDDFEQAAKTGKAEDVEVTSKALLSEYRKIVEAVDTFLAESKNEQLVKELKPYALGLKDRANACILLLEAYTSDNDSDRKSKFEQAEKLLAGLENHKVYTATAEFPSKELEAVSGQLVIEPNIKNLEELVKSYGDEK